MKFDGAVSTEVSEFGTYEIKNGKTTGVIHVPKKWIDKRAIVLFLKDGEVD